jgi:hypothetical protein
MRPGIDAVPPCQNAHTDDQWFANQTEPPMPRVTAPDQEQYTVLAHDGWNLLGCVTHNSNITEAEAKLEQLAAGSWFQEAVAASYSFFKTPKGCTQRRCRIDGFSSL